MYISCTSLLILLFIKSTVYCSAHFILLHIVFFLFYLYLCILSCVVLHILHCPLSGPDLIYISQLIIFCIIEYVMNKTLNLWRRWQNWRSWQIWRWWRKPKFVIFLTIKYIESTNYCIKTNTTNSDYVIVLKLYARVPFKYFDILLKHKIWRCWQIWHFFHKTNEFHRVH